MSMEQMDGAYVAALNGLTLCKACEKRRDERKDIITEFVETELKYGRDLEIIHDEFYRPMQIAGLLNKDQINGIFLNLDELIMAHRRFAERLEQAIQEAQSIGDTDLNSVHLGRLFVESAEMLDTYESYCIRQGSAACLLARLAKERELLRIFLRVSQMENTLLRRMNLAAFLMVPVQRVTKYPLLLNRLYKVTPHHHKDREALRDAQLKVELHLEHINQQTKGNSATNTIWRRISALSAASGSSAAAAATAAGQRRGLISAEDIGYMKLRKTAMELLNWDRDETQFIHSGEVSFAALSEYLVRQKMKSLRYMSAHALLIVLGKPNWKYRPDLVKSNLDNKLLTPTAGGNGIKEAALLLFREKNGRFVACREPLLLSNCVLSRDCSQFNYELPHSHFNSKQTTSAGTPGATATTTASASAATTTTTSTIASSSSSASTANLSNLNSGCGSAPAAARASPLASCPVDRRSAPSAVSVGGPMKKDSLTMGSEFRAASAESSVEPGAPHSACVARTATATSNELHSLSLFATQTPPERPGDRAQSDTISVSSLRSMPEERASVQLPPPAPTSRSYSLASALPRTPITTATAATAAAATTTSIGSLQLNKQHSSSPRSTSHTFSILNTFKSARHSASDCKSTTTTTPKAHEAGAGAKPTQMAIGSTKSVPGASDAPIVPIGTIGAKSTDDASHRGGGGGGGRIRASMSTSGAVEGPPAKEILVDVDAGAPPACKSMTGHWEFNGSSIVGTIVNGQQLVTSNQDQHQSNQYKLYLYYNHHQPYGDYEESFEIHECSSKESLLLRAETSLKTRYWLQMLRYHAKDLGHWRARRQALANIMMMRQE